MPKKILVSITTMPKADWREQIREINKLKLGESALFLTCLKPKQRQELYKLLDKSTLKSIPFVHIRSDMQIWELDYLVKTYRAKVFNIHPVSQYALRYNLGKYINRIYIENSYPKYREQEIEKFAGTCLDFSHLENDRIRRPKIFKHNIKILEKYPPGCNHISAVKNTAHVDGAGHKRYDDHILDNPSQIDYLKKYPASYFSRFLAIELNNNIKDQLIAKSYLEKLKAGL